MAERTVSVRLQAKVDQYVSGMKKANAATKQMQDAAEKARKEQVLLGKAATLVGAVMVANFTRKIVTAASDLNETMSKSTVVFRSNAAAVQKWSANSAKAFGMSRNAALGAASTYGNLFVSLGLAEGKSAEMSTRLVELAGDLASFNNIDPTQALDALRSGLVGETEPLRALGVNMNEATIRAQALKMGLDASTATLSPAVRAQAAYALILEQTKTAQGDFQRTAGGLANQQRILNAEWENAQAALGEALLPAAQGTVSALNDMLGVFNAAPAPVKNTTLAIAGLAAAAIILGPRLLTLKVQADAAGLSFGKMSKGLKGAGIATAAASASLIVVGPMVDAIGDSMFGVVKPADQLTDALERMARGESIARLGLFGDGLKGIGAEIEHLANPGVSQRVEDFFGTLAGNGGGEGRNRVLEQLAQVDQALANMVGSGNADAAAAAFSDIEKQATALGVSTEEVRNLFPTYGAAAAAAANQTAAVGDAAGTAATEVKTFGEALKGLNSPARDVTQAQIGVIDAAKNLAEGLKENGRSFSLSSQAGRDNLNTLMSLVSGIEEYGAAVEAKTGSQEKARAAVLRERDALVDNLTKTGMAKDAAQKLVDKYLKIPKAAEDAATAIDKVSAAAKRVPRVVGVKIQVTTSGNITGTGGGRNALEGDGGRGATSTWDPTKNPNNPFNQASGGYISGPGTSTSDSIAARLSNGEYVIRASSVRKYGTSTFDALNAGTFADGGLVDTGFKAATPKKKPAKKSRRRRGSSSSARAAVDSSAGDSFRNSASILGFDLGAYKDAVEQATRAADALAEARRRVVEASNPQEQAAAERDLAKATADAAAAERAKAAAKATGANIGKTFADRASKLARFRRNLSILVKRGLSRTIVQQLLDAGIDEGGDMAAALVRDGNIADLNKTQAKIDATSAALAAMGVSGASTTTGSTATSTSGTTSTAAAAEVTIRLADAQRPFVVKMDSTDVWQGLLKLKKSRGGASLGIS